jgi:transcription antitermination factor NusG
MKIKKQIELKKGDIVDIYQKPFTKEDFEGKAKIIEKAKGMIPPNGFQYYKVCFLNDKFNATRLVALIN